MEKLTTKEIVKKYGFKFTKSLGQNFLVDDSVLRDIIEGAEVCDEDFVIEIGPGIGTLTRELLKVAKKVSAIELDSHLLPILKEELKEFSNFELIHNDALKFDFNEIMGTEKHVKLVANLPYYLTTPMISKLLIEDYNFTSLTIMIQKEVGERIAASPSCKDYGALTLMVQYYCDVQVVRKVLPTSFIPQPKVESIIIRLNKLPEKRVKPLDEKLFFRLIRDSFNMRRKTLWNGLKSLKLETSLMEKAFELAEIDPIRRGETLSIQEFCTLSNCIYNLTI
jgi:16S rRNA (adenine1518-N6/adenine1519-N6)-dimethyltransferase